MEAKKRLKVFKASAGAGKTFTLAVQYIALMVVEPHNYQHVLAVTFTNKATGEMKQRILSQLYGIANGLPSSNGYVEKVMELLADEHDMTVDKETVRQRCEWALKNIVHDYSNFNIVTIDSFFQSIVRELANELGLAANINVELDTHSVLKKAVGDILDQLSVGTPEFASVMEFVSSRMEDGEAWKIEDSLVGFSENLMKEAYLVNDAEVRQRINSRQTLDDFRKKVFAFRDAQMARCNALIDGELAVIKQAIKKTECGDKFNSRTTAWFTKDWSKLKDWPDMLDKVMTDDSKLLNKAIIDNSVALAAVNGKIRPAISRMKETFEKRSGVEKDSTAATRYLYNLMVLGKISERVDELNKENNRFLLAETAQFLCRVINKDNLPFIYEKTGTVIRHIMIDEFQDTSTLQWQNFKPLLLECVDNDRSCLIVGDVKQSIYRFRNSDWHVLNGIADDSDVGRHIKDVKHEFNHRSDARIIQFNNSFFTNAVCWSNRVIAKRSKIATDALTTAYAGQEQKPENGDEQTGYVRVDYLMPQGDGIDYRQLQLERLHANIHQLLQAGVQQSDIAILVRTSENATSICQYFAQHRDEDNINIVSDEAFRLDSSSAVVIIIYALRCLSSQRDRMHLATLAYYYQTQVLKRDDIASDMSIVMMANNETLQSKYLPSDFVEHREEMRFKSITEIVEDVYRMFDLSTLEGQDAYMFFLQDVLEQYSQNNLADIDSFLAAWDDSLYKKTIPNGTSDGIRIMTQHKSKGLEFHTVIVPFCDWRLDTKDDEVLWCQPDTEPYSEMDLIPVRYGDTKGSSAFVNEEELSALVDNVNLLYVSFTRPKHNLVVISDNKGQESAKDPSKKSSAKVKGEDEKVLRANDLLNATMPEMMKDTTLEGLAKDVQDEFFSFTYGDIVPHVEKKEKVEEKNADKVNPIDRQYNTHDVQFQSLGTMAEFRQSNESDLFISSQSSNDTALSHADRVRLISLGNLYHNVLQGINTEADTHTAVMSLDRRGCFDRLADRDEVEKRISSLIKDIKPKHPEWFSDEWTPLCERSVMFAASSATDGKEQTGMFVTQRPDRVVVKGDSAIVIDYKTAQGVAHLQPDGTVAAPKHNREQVSEYCDLMRQLGYKNVKGYLWYVLDNLVCEVE